MRKYVALFLTLLCCSISSMALGNEGITFKLQDPKGSADELVDFVPTLIKFPFEIKYPESWYVREDVSSGMPCLFFTREPIKKEGDRYSVGASLFYNIGYFASKEPAESAIGKTAETVIKMRDWEESKKQFVESLKADGNSIISEADVTISGQPSLRVEYESKATRITTIYVKAGIHLLTIVFETPPKEYDQYKDIFEKMLSSFLFTR